MLWKKLGVNALGRMPKALTTFKIDMRSYLYTGPVPQYNPNEIVNEERLYNTLVASFGASVFFPKMKQRMNY